MSRDTTTSPQFSPAPTEPAPSDSAQPGPLTANDPREIGPYSLLGRLGQGGMGVVYLGEDSEGARAAVKSILPDLTYDPGFRARFQREIEVAKKVDSRFTAKVLAADALAEQPWMASEYVDAPPLNRLSRSGQRLPEIDVRQVVAGVAEALAAVHAAGLVHRDVKPGNILYGSTDPCLIDMGIARSIDGTTLTQTGKAIGTYGYQAPEQVQTGALSSAVDIWALGLVAFVIATGRWPFSGEIGSMGHLIKGEAPNLSLCPVYLRPLVASCLAEEPDARPSAADIVATNGDWSLLAPPAPAGYTTGTMRTSAATTQGFAAPTFQQQAFPPQAYPHQAHPQQPPYPQQTGHLGPVAPGPVAPGPASPTGTADLPTLSSLTTEQAQPSRGRWKVAVLAAAAVVLITAGVAVAANPGLLPGGDDTPQVGEVTPSVEPTVAETTPEPTTPADDSYETVREPRGREERDQKQPEKDEEFAPDDAATGEAAPEETVAPSESASSGPVTEPETEAPTAQPTPTMTTQPTEDPAEEPAPTDAP